MTTALDQTCSELAAIAGASHVTADEKICSQLAAGGKTPKVVVYPSSAEEVAEILRYASLRGLAVIPCRNATKLSIGNPPRRYDIALSLKELNRVWHFEPADLTVSVEPGMKFGDFQNFVAKHKLWLPLDPMGGGLASLGGILAANASGSLRIHYGTARDMTLGMRIATTEGKVIKAGGRVVKNVAGYDLTKLMIGSFGTLGVIVEASFKLFPAPAERATLVMTAQLLDKAREVRRAVQASHIRPLRCILVDAGLTGHLLKSQNSAAQGDGYEFWIEVGGTSRVLARCEEELKQIAARAGETIRSAAEDAPAEDSWGRLGDLNAQVAANANDWLLKVSLPVAKVEEFISRANRCLKPHGNIVRSYADPLAGIVHLWLHSIPSQGAMQGSVLELRNAASDLGGSLIVERAPAAGKVDAWGAVSDDFEIMRKLKEAWDPKGVLSPGRFVGGL
jgi:glycolate dehydrogenase FAD-binding subunit